MKNEEKSLQECLDMGKNYFYEYNNVRPNFISFHRKMIEYCGEENSNLFEKVYYRLIKDLPAFKIFGFNSEQFKNKLKSISDNEETIKFYEQEKNKASELLKAITTYRSEHSDKIVEVYRGKGIYDRIEENVYYKKSNIKSDSNNEERLNYYTEGMDNNTLIEIFSYEFISDYSNIDKSESNYVTTIIDKIEEDIILFLANIEKIYKTKDEAPPVEELPEPAKVTSEPIEETVVPVDKTIQTIEKIPATTNKTTELNEEIIEFTEEEQEFIKKTPTSTEKTAEPDEETLEFTEDISEPVVETLELVEVKTKPAKVNPASKSIPDKVSITKEQVDIVKILEAMYSSAIIPVKIEVRQIAQLFYNNQDDIDNFESVYNSQKMGFTEGNNEKLIQFIKSLSNGLEKFDIKEIIEHLITISFDK